MGIIQNEVVWNQKHRGMILLCSEFRYHSENFAMIAKFRYHSENTRHSEIQIFAMHSNFRYDSEKKCIAKISFGLRNFRYGCEIFAMHSENHVCLLLPPALPLHPVQLLIHHFHLTFLHFWVMKSPRILAFNTNTKPSLRTEVPNTCKTTKNNLETKSIALSGPAHVNWLNSYD